MLNKKTLSLLFIFCFSLTIFYLLKINQKSSDSAIKLLPQAKHLPRQSLKAIRYRSVFRLSPTSEFPGECFEPLKDFASKTSEEYVQLLSDPGAFEIHFGSECYKALQRNALFKNLLKSSSCKIGEKKSSACIAFLFQLKAFVISDFAKDKSPKEMTPEELLANFAKMFFQIDKLDKSQFKKNQKVLALLKEMFAHDPAFMEAYIGYLMIGKKITNDSIADNELQEFLQEPRGDSFRTDRLIALKPLINKDLNASKEVLDQLMNLYPQEPELSYYYAAYYWASGNRDLANQYIDQAISMGDKCTYCVPDTYKQTKAKLRAAELKDPSLFSISFGLNFEDL